MSRHMVLWGCCLMLLTACASPSVWQTVREKPPRVTETLTGQYRQVALCLILMKEADARYYNLIDDPDTKTARVSSSIGAAVEILLKQRSETHVQVEIRQMYYLFNDDEWRQHLAYARQCSERRAG